MIMKHKLDFWEELKAQKIEDVPTLLSHLQNKAYLESDKGKQLLQALGISLENYMLYCELPDQYRYLTGEHNE